MAEPEAGEGLLRVLYLASLTGDGYECAPCPHCGGERELVVLGYSYATSVEGLRYGSACQSDACGLCQIHEGEPEAAA